MLLWLTSLAVALTLVGGQGNNSDVEEASLFLEEYNNVSQTTFNLNMEAAWTFNTNITNENQKKMVRSFFFSLLSLEINALMLIIISKCTGASSRHQCLLLEF